MICCTDKNGGGAWAWSVWGERGRLLYFYGLLAVLKILLGLFLQEGCSRSLPDALHRSASVGWWCVLGLARDVPGKCKREPHPVKTSVPFCSWCLFLFGTIHKWWLPGLCSHAVQQDPEGEVHLAFGIKYFVFIAVSYSLISESPIEA